MTCKRFLFTVKHTTTKGGQTMKTRFLCDIPNARLLRNNLDKGNGKEVECVIERNIYIGKDDFIYFREHLLESNPNIIKYKNEMFIDNKGIWHILMFCSMRSDIMLLVYCDGCDYAKYVSIITNGGEKVEPRFTTSQRYTRK